MIDFDSKEPGARIKVIGVGGGGGNAVNTMVAARLEGAEFIAANTDTQALSANRADVKLQLGKDASRGLGAGADPDRGRDAALEQKEADRHDLFPDVHTHASRGSRGIRGHQPQTARSGPATSANLRQVSTFISPLAGGS